MANKKMNLNQISNYLKSYRFTDADESNFNNQIETDYIDYFKKGSKIRIKKKNRGKFTEYCGGNVTQECIDRAKGSSNPTLRKRATFAENSRKWHHK